MVMIVVVMAREKVRMRVVTASAVAYGTGCPNVFTCITHTLMRTYAVINSLTHPLAHSLTQTADEILSSLSSE